MKYKLNLKRSEAGTIWVYKARVLTGLNTNNAKSFAKAVSLSFGRYLNLKKRYTLAEEFLALGSAFLYKYGYRPSEIPRIARKICTTLKASGLRIFNAEGEEIWETSECPESCAKVILVQLRESICGKVSVKKTRDVEVTPTSTGRWVKLSKAPRNGRGIRVAILHSESYLCCLGCGAEMLNWAELFSHAETYVRSFELNRTDPSWRRDFWESEKTKPTILCGQATSEALTQRKVCAEMAIEKLETNDLWEYSEQKLYAYRLGQWAEMLSTEEVALGWDTETAVASGEIPKPDGPEMEALAFEAAEKLNTPEAQGSVCNSLIPVCVQISGRGERLKRALKWAGRKRSPFDSVTWHVWDCEGDSGIPKDVTVLTAALDPAETVENGFVSEDLDWSIHLLGNMMNVLDRLFTTMSGGKCLRMVLYAHNAARFDNVLLLQTLRRYRGPETYRVQFFRGAVQRIVYYPEETTCGFYGCRRCEIVFCDTCLVFPAPLAQLSKELELSGGGKLDLDARACSDVWVTKQAWKATPALIEGDSGKVLKACIDHYPKRFAPREENLNPLEDVFYHILVYAVRDAVAVLELAEKQSTYLEAILNEVRAARGPKVGDESEWVKIPLGGINTISGFSYICTSAMLYPNSVIIPQGARAADINACMIGGHTEVHAQGFLLYNEGPMLGKGPLRQLDIDGMYCNIQRAKIFPAGKPQAITKKVADDLNVWLSTVSKTATLEESPHGPVFGTFEIRLSEDERSWPAVGVLGVKMRVEYDGETVNNQVWTNIPRRQRMTLLHALTFIRRGFQVRLISPDGVSWGTHFPDGVCAPFLAGMDLYLAGKARSKKEGKKAMTMVYKLVANANFGQMAMQSTRAMVFEVEEKDYQEKVEKREVRGDFELQDVTEVAPHVLLVKALPKVITHSRPHQWGTMILAGAHSEFSDFAARFDPLLGLVPPRDRPLGITHGDTDSIFVPESLAIGCVGPGWWQIKGKPQQGGSSALSVTLDEKEPFGKGLHVVISKKKENILLNALGNKEFVVAKGMSLKDLQPKHFYDVWEKEGISEALSRQTLKKSLKDARITEATLTRKMRLIPVIMGEKRNSRRLKQRSSSDVAASKLSKQSPLLYTDLTSLLDLVRGFRPGYVLRRVIFFNAQPLDFVDDGANSRPPQMRCCKYATDIVEIRWPKKLRAYFPGTAEANYKVDFDLMQEAKATMLVCRNNLCRGRSRPHPPQAIAEKG